MTTQRQLPTAGQLANLNLAQDLYGVHDFDQEWINQHVLQHNASAWALSVHSLGLNPGDHGHSMPTGNPSPSRIVEIARLNHAYNGVDGTIPLREPEGKPAVGYQSFAQRIVNFIVASNRAGSPCRNWIIGNEPNISGERPQGQVITPDMMAECFAIVYRAVTTVVREIPSLGPQRLWMPAVAPYNEESGDWIKYQLDMMNACLHKYGVMPDAFTGHAYTRGSSPHNISAPLMMGPPYTDRFSGFRTYEDLLLKGTPKWAQSLPFLITEFDEYDKWEDKNTGVVQRAYDHVAVWNSNLRNQPVQGLLMYRWFFKREQIGDDKWGFGNLNGVRTDFDTAVRAHNHPAPLPANKGVVVNPADKDNTTFLPDVSTGPTPDTPPPPPPNNGSGPGTPPAPSTPAPLPTDWDQRLVQRGIKVTRHVPTRPGELYWELVKGEFLEQKEHTFVNTYGEDGRPEYQVELRWYWGNGGPSEQEIQKTRDVSGDPYALGMANFAMYNAGWSYGLNVLGRPSDQIFGMGLGTPEEPTWNHHRSFRFHFRLKRAAENVGTPTTPPPVAAPNTQPKPPTPVPALVYPLSGKRFPVTSNYGDNPNDYKQFIYDGVPLRGHNGIDLGAPRGTPILAVDNGYAVEAGVDPDPITGGLGLYVKLIHKWGETVYAHLDRLAPGFAPGSSAGAGSVIGYVGSSGNSTGPHLHFSVRINPYRRNDGMGGFSNPTPLLSSATVHDLGGGTTPPPSPQPQPDPGVPVGQGAPSEFWAKVWPIVLDIEGNDRLSTDRNDRGNYRPNGEFVGTKYGISALSNPDVDIPNLTQNQALQLYYTRYWLPSGAHLMKWPMCLVHFDSYVQNTVAAQRFLVESGSNPLRYLAARLAWYTSTPTWQHHGAGWANRVSKIMRIVADHFNSQLTQL